MTVDAKGKFLRETPDRAVKERATNLLQRRNRRWSLDHTFVTTWKGAGPHYRHYEAAPPPRRALKQHARAELQPPRSSGRQDLTKRRRAEKIVGQVVVGPVEQIERFGAQLDPRAAA